MLPVYNPDLHIPPPPPMPTLTVTPKGARGYQLQLHTTLRQALSLRHGQPIDLIPPVFGSLYWHLDLRAHAARRVVWYDDTSVRAFGIRLPPGLVTAPLTLHLLLGVPAHANYYPLVPVDANPAQ